MVARLVKYDELDKVKVLIDIEDWGDSLEYIREYYSQSPPTCYVYEDDTGEIVSFCFGCILDDNTGMIGYFITHPKYRGKGYGRVTFRKTMEAMGERNVALNAAPDTGSIYNKLGFVVQGFPLIACQGNVHKSCEFSIDKVIQNIKHYKCYILHKNATSSIDLHEKHSNIKLLNEMDKHIIDRLIAYDRDNVLDDTNRSERLRLWLDRSSIIAFIEDDNEIKGFISMRNNRDVGYRCGSLYADDVSLAQVLLSVSLSVLEDNVLVQVAVYSNTIIDTLTSFGLETYPGFSRLYTKENTKVQMEKVYALNNFESEIV